MSLIQLKSDHQHDLNQSLPQEQIPVVEDNANEDKKHQKRRKVRIKTLPSNDPDEFFHADILIPLLEDSLQIVENPIFDAISTVRKNLQAQVYYGIVENSRDYLKRLYKHDERSRMLVRDQINTMVLNIHNLIAQQITVRQQFEIFKIKPEYQKNAQAAIKIRQQLLKAKISDLRTDLTLDQNNSSAMSTSLINPTSSDMYSPTHPRTIKAQQFVRRMQNLQQQQRQARKRKQYLREQKKKEQEQQKKQLQQRMKIQRTQFLTHQYALKRKQKQQQRKFFKEEKQKFSQFYKQFRNKKPIYQKNQQDFFKNHIMVENKKKLQILQNIKEDHRPISLDQLKEHQKQYLQIKEDNEYESNAARAMEVKARKNSQKKYYKSKFYSAVEKQEKEKQDVQDEFEIKQKMHEKKLQYWTQIKTKFVPKIDVKKQMEVKERQEKYNLMEKMRNNKRIRSGQTCRNDGKDNLQKLHRYIGELKAKGQIKKQDYRTLEMTPQPHSGRYKNYLKELRESGTTASFHPKHHSIDYSNLAEKDAQKTKFNALQKQYSASRREHYLTNLRSSDIQKYMIEKGKIDDDYLESARAKMALINKFNN